MTTKPTMTEVIGDGHFKPPTHATSGPCCMTPGAIDQIADALAAAGYGDTTAAKAEALREAADELGGFGDTVPPREYIEVADSLRDRANKLQEQINE